MLSYENFTQVTYFEWAGISVYLEKFYVSHNIIFDDEPPAKYFPSGEKSSEW